MSKQLAVMAEQLNIEPGELQSIIMKTVMPSKVQVSNEQFVSFMAIANEYNLNPLSKEIYAFPAKGGGIQAVVSIDGWLKIINNHPQFDGMELTERFDEKGVIDSVECKIHRKDRSFPTVVSEYLSECIRNTDPWKKKIRMLRHKATIQASRYAFGLSGISDQDDAELAMQSEKDITPTKSSTLNKLLQAPEPIQPIQPEPIPSQPVPSQPDPIKQATTDIEAAALDTAMVFVDGMNQAMANHEPEVLKNTFKEAWLWSKSPEGMLHQDAIKIVYESCRDTLGIK